jgi:hypothetical protein
MNRIINTTLLLNPLNWIIVPLMVLLFGLAISLITNPHAIQGELSNVNG